MRTMLTIAALAFGLAMPAAARRRPIITMNAPTARSFEVAFYPETKAAYLQIDGKSLVLPKRFSLISQRFKQGGYSFAMRRRQGHHEARRQDIAVPGEITATAILVRGDNMNRRCVLQMLLGSAMAGSASAQKILTVAYLGSAGLEKEYVAAFRRGLADHGYVIDQNIEVLFRAAEGDFSRLPAIFAEATARKLDALVVVGNQAALFAQAANLSLPIVFVIGADPVDLGLATNYSKPTGNMTGITFYTGALAEKRLEFLNELLPPNIPAAVLFNPETPQLAVQKSTFSPRRVL